MALYRIHPEICVVRMDDATLRTFNMVREAHHERPLHKCSVCGGCAEWSDSWSWHGSYRDLDDGTIAKFCGPACRTQFSETQNGGGCIAPRADLPS